MHPALSRKVSLPNGFVEELFVVDILSNWKMTATRAVLSSTLIANDDDLVQVCRVIEYSSQKPIFGFEVFEVDNANDMDIVSSYEYEDLSQAVAHKVKYVNQRAKKNDCSILKIAGTKIPQVENLQTEQHRRQRAGFMESIWGQAEECWYSVEFACA